MLEESANNQSEKKDKGSVDRLIETPNPENSQLPSVSDVMASSDNDKTTMGPIEPIPLANKNEGFEADLDMEKLPEDFQSAGDVDDKETESAVDDILRTDADAALPHTLDPDAVIMKPSILERFKNAWYSWWENKWARYGTIATGVVLALLIIFVHPVQAIVLNVCGVRSAAVVTVLDGASNTPLKNAVVTIGGKTTKTGNDGRANIVGISLGNHNVRIQKVAFATTTMSSKYFGISTVELGNVTLKPTGIRLTFKLTDYLSGKPVANVEIASGQATAESSENGTAIMTTLPGNTSPVVLMADGYRTEHIAIASDGQTDISEKLVPSAEAVYVSKQSSTYDVYKVYVDGQDRSVLLKGTGLETQNINILPNPDSTKVALASTRDNKRNSDGYLLTALNIVDMTSGNPVNIDYAEQVTLLAWSGTTLVYERTTAAASAAKSTRQEILAYDTSTNKRYLLASANYFAGYQLIASTLYYAVSATDPSATQTFVQINIDGSHKKVIYSDDVWTLLRTNYNVIYLQTPNKWYSYSLGQSVPVETTPPVDMSSRVYIDSPDGKTSARVDIRDSNGVLLLRNLATGKETTLATQKGMQTPSYWLNARDVVYQVAISGSTSEYVMSANGGMPQKIADVTPIGIQ